MAESLNTGAHWPECDIDVMHDSMVILWVGSLWFVVAIHIRRAMHFVNERPLINNTDELS